MVIISSNARMRFQHFIHKNYSQIQIKKVVPLVEALLNGKNCQRDRWPSKVVQEGIFRYYIARTTSIYLASERWDTERQFSQCHSIPVNFMVGSWWEIETSFLLLLLFFCDLSLCPEDGAWDWTLPRLFCRRRQRMRVHVQAFRTVQECH